MMEVFDHVGGLYLEFIDQHGRWHVVPLRTRHWTKLAAERLEAANRYLARARSAEERPLRPYAAGQASFWANHKAGWPSNVIQNPYRDGTPEQSAWDVGYEDADWWLNEGQYLD